ncbi:uncharacterized protein LOC131696186 [Topomyia yanbarensis]|nr:uncharacterized protein LOC131696186 [Topomyia yanbarensis]
MPELQDNNAGADLYSIILSHMSLLKQTDHFSLKALETFQPDVIFSAHDHTSKYTIVQKDALLTNPPSLALNTKRDNRHDLSTFNLYGLRSNQQLLEISVPTCSYRMGVMKIGYGFAVLDGATLRYTVLWTSQRLYQLAIYSLLIIPLKLLCGQIWCNVLKRYWCCYRKRNRNYLPLHAS